MTTQLSSLFRCIDNSRQPIGIVDPIKWCLNDSHKELVERLRRTTDTNEQRRIKNQLLPAISVSGTFNKRQKSEIDLYNQLVGLDFDYNTNPDLDNVEAFKQHVFEHPSVLFTIASCGGKGVFGMVRGTTIENHYAHFNALREDFLKMGLVLDENTSDITRLRVKSYDPAPLLRLDAPVYTRISNAKSVTNYLQKDQSNPKPHLAARPNIRWTPPPAVSSNIKELAASMLNPQPLPKWSTGIVPSGFNGTQAVLYLILAKVANSGFDITGYAPDWITIAGVMARCFGEWGRELFHDVCRHYPRYTETECDAKYDEFLHGANYEYAVNSVRKIAQYYGF